MGSTAGVDAGIRRRLTARFGVEVAVWLDDLPDVLSDLERRWGFELEGPVPRGSMSAVFHCRMADGRHAVLKASPDRARLAFEAAALNGWHTGHTPAVMALDERLGALLLEAIEPGTPVVEPAVEPSAKRVAELMNALHGSGFPDPKYPTVEQRVDHLFESSTKLYEWHPGLTALVSKELYERGRALATRLARDRLPVVLLHGDLTPSNVLDGGAGRGLVAIDPAPCLGDAAFDAVDLIFWRAGDLATIEARAGRLAAASGLAARRMLDWCSAFAGMCALELASKPEADRGLVEALVALASRA
jgi:streptomycin 6-kinase